LPARLEIRNVTVHVSSKFVAYVEVTSICTDRYDEELARANPLTFVRKPQPD